MICGPARPGDGVPPVLPLLTIQRLEGDELLISENGYPARGVPTGRLQLGEAIARFAERAGGPIRIEVHEPDGASYADILAPRPKPTIEAKTATDWVEITARGFVAGEDVAIAPVIGATSARRDGLARALINRSELPETATEVILLGQTSGTLTVECPQQEAARTCPSDLQ